MENKQIYDLIEKKINEGGDIQPILFLGNQITTSSFVLDLSNYLFDKFEVDKNNIFSLSDNGESLKIAEVKEFVQKSFSKSGFKFQIFFIENIQRLTPEAGNSLLKVLEEPKVGNLFFLSSNSESMILDTILSRVQVVDLSGNSISLKNEFFYDMIKKYFEEKNLSIFSYFFNDKNISKLEYISFLNNLILYFTNTGNNLNLIEEVSKSINFIQKNNVIPKIEIDRILLLIK